MNMLIAWILLTWPLIFFGVPLVLIAFGENKDDADEVFAPVSIAIICLWWGIYFLI